MIELFSCDSSSIGINVGLLEMSLIDVFYYYCFSYNIRTVCFVQFCIFAATVARQVTKSVSNTLLISSPMLPYMDITHVVDNNFQHKKGAQCSSA